MDVEHLLAARALKMVVVMGVGVQALVTWAVARQGHGLDQLLGQQVAQRTVDGGDAERGDGLAARLQNFLRPQRPFGLVDDPQDLGALSGHAFHTDGTLRQQLYCFRL